MLPVSRLPLPAIRRLRPLVFAGLAALALSACASNRTTTSVRAPDFSSQSTAQSQSTLMELAARYRHKPRDKATIIYYAAALRAHSQSEQAAAVLEAGMAVHRQDPDIRVAYAKALTASGRFEQALAVVDDTIDRAAPNWDALSVKGAVLDQMGRHEEARRLYRQAIGIAPGEASLYANLGLSHAMTNDLPTAERELRRAVGLRTATSKVRQNLALVIGLQGRFEECEAIFAAELPPDQVEANMSYIRALLTQQNRWDLIKGAAG